MEEEGRGGGGDQLGFGVLTRRYWGLRPPTSSSSSAMVMFMLIFWLVFQTFYYANKYSTMQVYLRQFNCKILFGPIQSPSLKNYFQFTKVNCCGPWGDTFQGSYWCKLMRLWVYIVY